MNALRFGFALAGACLVATVSATADQPPRKDRFSDTAQVTAVEMVVQVQGPDGAVPADLEPTDFEVTEDGQPAQVVGVEPFRLPSPGAPRGAAPAPALSRGDQGSWDWRLVIWIDQELSSSRSIRRAAEALAAQAGALTGLGTVEIVIAGSDRKFVLPRTRSSPLVAETLLSLARETPGRDQLRQIRKQYMDTLQLQGEMDGRNMPKTAPLGSGPPGGDSEGGLVALADVGAKVSRRSVARESAAQERLLIDRRLDMLVGFLSINAEPAPKSLILVNDGWDLDPRDFYLVGMPNKEDFGFELTALLETSDGGSAFDGISRHLSTTGWTSLSIATGALEAGSTFAAERTGHGRLGEIMTGGEDSISETPMRLVMKPNEPLYALAEATGGEALTGVRELPGALGRLADRVRITYQVSRPPDARQRKVEVRSLRPGLEVRAPTWAGIPAIDAMSSARARNLLAGEEVRGDLRLEVAVGVAAKAASNAISKPGSNGAAKEDAPADPKAGRVAAKLQARLDLTPLREALAASPASDVHVTVAVSVPGAAPFVHQSVVREQRLAGLSAWTYSLPIDLPAAFDRIAVVLEESSTTGWGGGLAAIVEGPLPDPRTAAAAATAVSARDDSARVEPSPDAIFDLLPARKPVLLAPPDVEPAIGRITIEPIVAATGVARIDYLLDGQKAGASGEPPFAVRIDLGSIPTPRELVAVARDAAGAELGRDTLTLNSGAGTFDVRIIEPRVRHRVGPVDVEAEISIPGRRIEELDRLELFWNDRRVATLHAPPFRQRILIPAESPTGFITAVAHRKDGTSVEDVVLMNDAGGAEAVNVALVELAATVLDGAGRPRRGLDAGAFQVLEESVAQSLDAVRDGRELPLTLGVALDSSGSMFEEMSAVKTAAIDFLSLTLDPADRAFVVDFDSQPRLAVDLTGDQRELASGIARIKPGGSTALCDALVYSLARLQRVRGRRALVVLSDGIGRDERVSFAACQRFVARSGVPVYLLVLPEGGPAEPRRAKAAVDRAVELVRPSGGRVIQVDGASQLGAVYRGVQEELRAQYVLSYYPTASESSASTEPVWRPVEIHVLPPGLSIRAPRGYYR